MKMSDYEQLFPNEDIEDLIKELDDPSGGLFEKRANSLTGKALIRYVQKLEESKPSWMTKNQHEKLPVVLSYLTHYRK
jgi:translation initiation factor 2B subunit (eIF-2B alpha/beta/delta family)